MMYSTFRLMFAIVKRISAVKFESQLWISLIVVGASDH